MELVTGADGEFAEDLMQVVFDSSRAHEELGSDFRVGQAVAGKPGDLGLPCGELGRGIGGACVRARRWHAVPVRLAQRTRRLA